MKTAKFSDRLRYLIDQKKIDQKGVAKAIGIDRAQVSKWLSETVGTPRRTTLQKLADFFGCNIDWLATGVGETNLAKFAGSSPAATNQVGNDPLVPESEALVLRAYRELAKMDADFLLEVHAWLKEEDSKRPGFSSWFRLEFANRFPEFAEWQEKISKKVA